MKNKERNNILKKLGEAVEGLDIYYCEESIYSGWTAEFPTCWDEEGFPASYGSFWGFDRLNTEKYKYNEEECFLKEVKRFFGVE